MIKTVCVFCGSHDGARPAYRDAAVAMGAELARRGLALVYGGGNVGTMGTLARAALEGGAHVTGVIPKKLYALVDHVELSELVVSEGMHDRKARMAEESDAFVVLPGGIGTLEEFFEAWAWRQIGYHAKPIGILDVEGFYRPLLSFLDRVVDEGFLKAVHREDLVVEEDPGRLLDLLMRKGPPAETKRPERSQGT